MCRHLGFIPKTTTLSTSKRYTSIRDIWLQCIMCIKDYTGADLQRCSCSARRVSGCVGLSSLSRAGGPDRLTPRRLSSRPNTPYQWCVCVSVFLYFCVSVCLICVHTQLSSRPHTLWPLLSLSVDSCTADFLPFLSLIGSFEEGLWAILRSGVSYQLK